MTDFLDRISKLSPKRLALLALELHEQVEASRRRGHEATRRMARRGKLLVVAIVVGGRVERTVIGCRRHADHRHLARIHGHVLGNGFRRRLAAARRRARRAGHVRRGGVLLRMARWRSLAERR